MLIADGQRKGVWSETAQPLSGSRMTLKQQKESDMTQITSTHTDHCCICYLHLEFITQVAGMKQTLSFLLKDKLFYYSYVISSVKIRQANWTLTVRYMQMYDCLTLSPGEWLTFTKDTALSSLNVTLSTTLFMWCLYFQLLYVWDFELRSIIFHHF